MQPSLPRNFGALVLVTIVLAVGAFCLTLFGDRLTLGVACSPHYHALQVNTMGANLAHCENGPDTSGGEESEHQPLPFPDATQKFGQHGTALNHATEAEYVRAA